MKKIFTCFIVTVMVLMNGISVTSAMSNNESYIAAKGYYAKKKVLQGYDEVVAYASLGLDAGQLKMENVIDTQYASSIAKTVIALTLHGDDPRNYQKTNYVDMLEKCVQETGAVDKINSTTYANFQISCVNALYIVQSSYVNKAADYLASLQMDNGAFESSYSESLDITAWAIETLSLVDQIKYQTAIDQAVAYMKTKQDENAGYKDYYSGVNVNTQACVLMGLLAYDATGLKAGKYNQEDKNPYDVLLTYQNGNGSFWYGQVGEDNYYATVQGIQAVGYYNQGSVYKKAYQLYQKMMSSNQNQSHQKDENTDQEDNHTTLSNTNLDTQNKPEKSKVVETSDRTELLLYTSFIAVSALAILKGKRYFE